MLKRLGIPLVALLALLMIVSPTPANAKVRFGVGIYTGPPVYSYPAYPYAYPYPYSDYYYDYGYGYPVYPRAYGYYPRRYYAPSYQFRGSFGHDRFRERGGQHFDHDRGRRGHR
jgi:hypothetical protein